MKRRSFLKDCLLGMAFALVPKILQPVLPEVVEENLVTFEGILPYIQRNAAVVDYDPRVGFALNDIDHLLIAQDKLKRYGRI